MNNQQFQTLINLLLGAGGPLAALLVQWGIPQSTVTQVAQLLLIVVPPGYAYWRSHQQHSDSNLLVAASTVSGASVTVDETKATAAVTATAKDQSNAIKLS